MMTDFDKYVIARWAYSIGEEFIPDYEWQMLHEKFLKDDKHKEFASTSWSHDTCPTELLREYNLTDLIRHITINQDKSESIPSINTMLEASTICNNYNEPVILSVKADGWNIQVDYYEGALIQARTRGRSSDAIQAYNIEPYLPQRIPLKGKVRVFGEGVCPNELFSLMKKQQGVVSQRNCVSTALANPIYTPMLELRTFDLEVSDKEFDTQLDKLNALKECGFLTVDYDVSYSDHLMNVKRLSELKSQLNYITDGCVIRPLKMPSQKKYALRIYDWAEPYYVSYIQGYTSKYAPLYISLQLKIFPIKTDRGSTQRIIDIDNLDRILSNNLMKGSPIAFTMKSHAIADIDINMTRLLQEKYKDRYEIFHNKIEKEEAMKEWYLAQN